MSYFSTKKIVKRKDIGEIVDGNQVYDIVESVVDSNREFHQIEAAIVNHVWLDPKAKEFPKIKVTIGTEEILMPNYSLLGTITATYTHSRKTINFVKSISSHMVVYPDVGEKVNMANFDGDIYWYSPLNLNQNVNVNRIAGIGGNISHEATKFNRKLAPQTGDVIIQGRYGQSMRFGSDSGNEFPTVKIVCGQAEVEENVDVKNADSAFPQIENLDFDGSSIYMTSGPEEIGLIPSSKTDNKPTKLFGNQIILNSDRIIFQAKGNPVNKTGSIHMFASNQVLITANTFITLECGAGVESELETGGYKRGHIYLGTKADEEQNPIVKGRQLADVLEGILKMVSEFATAIQTGAVDGADITPTLQNSSTNLLAQLDEVKKTIPTMYSKTVFTHN